MAGSAGVAAECLLCGNQLVVDWLVSILVCWLACIKLFGYLASGVKMIPKRYLQYNQFRCEL